ncbi:hypothetical protein Dform_01649 [Dehalogenimonas formicexedens]|uniref:Integral membrane protein n=1 Tax=Dehalogenimonas formicexedens TaxID=1839801 RepID=A0A1P8F958_9CHLR|nr:hypothetical protein [Dehalogenimonas formicexedens]APV44970.1 hypothetical protein Dform_01649 [Dehalogenimonas formicexedens]
MRLGLLEIVLTVIVLLSVLVVWRWMRQGGPDSGAGDGGPVSSFLQKIGTIGILLVVGGLGLILVGYIVLIGLAKMFIWAVAILVLGLAFLVLSRR